MLEVTPYLRQYLSIFRPEVLTGQFSFVRLQLGLVYTLSGVGQPRPLLFLRTRVRPGETFCSGPSRDWTSLFLEIGPSRYKSCKWLFFNFFRISTWRRKIVSSKYPQNAKNGTFFFGSLFSTWKNSNMRLLVRQLLSA